MTTPAPEPLPRETGEEQASPCPRCGSPRHLLHNGDGSTSPSPCPKCFTTETVATVSVPTTASEEAPPRENGLPTNLTAAATEEVPHAGS